MAGFWSTAWDLVTSPVETLKKGVDWLAGQFRGAMGATDTGPAANPNADGLHPDAPKPQGQASKLWDDAKGVFKKLFGMGDDEGGEKKGIFGRIGDFLTNPIAAVIGIALLVISMVTGLFGGGGMMSALAMGAVGALVIPSIVKGASALLGGGSGESRTEGRADIGNAANLFEQISKAREGNTVTATRDIVTKAARDANFASIERSHSLPTGLLSSVMHAECGQTLGETSSAGACGPFQLMPATAAHYKVANPNDPKQAAEGAASHLEFLMKRYNGDVKLAAAAYNWGHGNLDSYLKDGKWKDSAGRTRTDIPEETVKYVAKVTSAMALYAPLGDQENQRLEAIRRRALEDAGIRRPEAVVPPAPEPGSREAIRQRAVQEGMGGAHPPAVPAAAPATGRDAVRQRAVQEGMGGSGTGGASPAGGGTPSRDEIRRRALEAGLASATVSGGDSVAAGPTRATESTPVAANDQTYNLTIGRNG